MMPHFNNFETIYPNDIYMNNIYLQVPNFLRNQLGNKQNKYILIFLRTILHMLNDIFTTCKIQFIKLDRLKNPHQKCYLLQMPQK